MRAIYSGLLLAFFSLSFCSCTRQIEDISAAYKADSLSLYFPIKKGKYLIYRLDSTVFTQSGRVMELRSYQEKNVVDEPFKDNLGRTSHRIIRYLRDAAGTTDWLPVSAHYVTITDQKIEVVENNLRTVRLMYPLKENFTWKGNTHLPYEPYANTYSTFSNQNAMANWQFTYNQITPEYINGNFFAHVITVNHVNDSVNYSIKPTDFLKPKVDTAFASKSYSVDKYAKHMGLVYQELILWEYEPNRVPNPGGNPPFRYDPYNRGFGVKRTLIDFN